MQGIITTVNFYSGTIHPENVLFRYNMSIPAQKQELNWIALLRTKTLTSLLCLNTFDAQVKVNIHTAHTKDGLESAYRSQKWKGVHIKPHQSELKGDQFFSQSTGKVCDPVHIHWPLLQVAPSLFSPRPGHPSLRWPGKPVTFVSHLRSPPSSFFAIRQFP